MQKNSRGAEQIQKVLELFKIEYQRQKSFLQMKSVTGNNATRVDYAIKINDFWALIEINDQQEKSIGKSGTIFQFAQKFDYPLLLIDLSNIKQVQSQVSQFIDDLRKGASNLNKEYSPNTWGYFGDYPYAGANETSLTTKEKPQPETIASPEKEVELSKEDYQKLRAENENLQAEVVSYRNVISEFMKQIADLNILMERNNKKIRQLDKYGKIEKSVNIHGGFRINGKQGGRLTKSAQAVVLAAAQEFDGNWAKTKQFIGAHYGEDVSTSTIKRIYQKNNKKI